MFIKPGFRHRRHGKKHLLDKIPHLTAKQSISTQNPQKEYFNLGSFLIETCQLYNYHITVRWRSFSVEQGLYICEATENQAEYKELVE